MSDRGRWVVRGIVAGAVVMTLGFMGCSQQKPEAPPEEPAPKAEVKPLPPPPPPAPMRAAPAPVVSEQTYVVQKGEGLMAIARRFGVDWHELARINNIQGPKYLIKAGQKLTIPGGGGGGGGTAPAAPKGGGLNQAEPF